MLVRDVMEADCHIMAEQLHYKKPSSELDKIQLKYVVQLARGSGAVAHSAQAAGSRTQGLQLVSKI